MHDGVRRRGKARQHHHFNPAQGKTYEVFKLLDVVEDESDLENNGFIYKLTGDAWATFITTVQDGSGKNYFNLFENGGTKYVLANENLKPGIADFAAKAKAYAEEKKLQPVQTWATIWCGPIWASSALWIPPLPTQR